MLIGIDDTDSKDGMCTTYLATVLKTALETELREVVSLYLVRLNPTIRFKTRGNAAIGIFIKNSYEVKDIVQQHIEKMAHLNHENTNPGVVLFDCEFPPSEVQAFAREAMRAELQIGQAAELIDRYGIDFLSYKNGRGLIGALAAIGAVLEKDYTYELIAYRYKQNFKKERYIHRGSVYRADIATYPYTWDTVDRKNETITFSPHSPDPVLYGIRGDDPCHILAAHGKIISEPFEYLALYKTNQGTDMHIQTGRIGDLVEGRSYNVRATVSKEPWTIKGGHTFFQVSDEERVLLCAVFEPTKQFRAAARRLCVGDAVAVQGSFIKNCFHLEKMQLIELSRRFISSNPVCCNKSMKSRGKNKGFKCSTCKMIERRAYAKGIPVVRDIKLGIYEATPSARRHITKPLVRTRNLGYNVFPSR